MTPERWSIVKSIFHGAVEREGGDREAFLADRCSGDAELRAQVEKLLRHHAAPTVAGRPGEPERADEDLSVESQTTAAHTPFLRASDRIGSYRVLRVLGEGGMGVVYLAEQEKPKRTVALKMIRPGVATAQMMRRFEHEAQVLGRLQHPGIAQIFEAGATNTGQGPQPYFAMEYVRGKALPEFARENNLGTRQRLELFAKVCDAVQHAHQKGVIHRDLKPSNILVDETGQPKILDFGVARAIDSDIQTTTLQTDIGQLIGTIPYMSPEQASGSADDLDTRSDVYSLGVILYELLAGRLPYDLTRKLVHEAVRIIQHDEPTRLSSISRVFRGDIETIAGKALEKERARRYQSASDLAADVRLYLADEPLRARAPSAAYRLRKFARRNRSRLVALAAVVLLAAATGAVMEYRRAAARSREVARIASERKEEAEALLAPWAHRGFEHAERARVLMNRVARRLDNSPVDQADVDLFVRMCWELDLKGSWIQLIRSPQIYAGIPGRSIDAPRGYSGSCSLALFVDGVAQNIGNSVQTLTPNSGTAPLPPIVIVKAGLHSLGIGASVQLLRERGEGESVQGSSLTAVGEPVVLAPVRREFCFVDELPVGFPVPVRMREAESRLTLGTRATSCELRPCQARGVRGIEAIVALSVPREAEMPVYIRATLSLKLGDSSLKEEFSFGASRSVSRVEILHDPPRFDTTTLGRSGEPDEAPIRVILRVRSDRYSFDTVLAGAGGAQCTLRFEPEPPDALGGREAFLDFVPWEVVVPVTCAP